jgi:hypothetical protein
VVGSIMDQMEVDGETLGSVVPEEEGAGDDTAAVSMEEDEPPALSGDESSDDDSSAGGQEDSEEEDRTGGSDSGVAAADATSEPSAEQRRVDLVARLRAAIEEAQARAGKSSVDFARAATIVAGGMSRTLRLQRREISQRKDRFPLVEKEVVDGAGMDGDVVAAMCAVFGPGAVEALRHPDVPAAPPEPEDETVGPGGALPLPLPKARAQWEVEKERQGSHPFVAGGIERAGLKWKEARPVRRKDKVWSWGGWLSTQGWDPVKVAELLKLVAKDVRTSAVRPCRWEDLDVVTPIHVVYHPVSLKARLVHDLRALNVLLKASTVVYESALAALCGASLGAKLDILSAFRHVAVKEEDARVLGFVINGQPFRWEVLPFGCSQAPELFTAALQPVIEKLRRAGIFLVVYCDDILVLASSQGVLDVAMERLMVELRGAGWYVALDKTFVWAAEVVPFLGLLVDCKLQCLRVSVAKALKLELMCVAALDGRRLLSLRSLQKIGGLLAFFLVAVPSIGLARSGINAAMGEAFGLPGASVGVKGELLDDLRFWVAQAKDLPTETPIVASQGHLAVVTDAAGYPNMGYGGVVWEGRETTPDIEALLPAEKDLGKEVCSGRAGSARMYAGPLPVSCRLDSSAALEVRAFRQVLRRHEAATGVRLLGLRIRWWCDAQVAVTCARKWRAKARGLLFELKRLWQWLRSRQCTVAAFWVARELGWQPVADFLSKLHTADRSAEWTLPREVVAALVKEGGWAPTIDMFATKGNKSFDSWASRWPEPGAAVDALALDWSGVRAWAYPPFGDLAAVWLRLRAAVGYKVWVILPADSTVPVDLPVTRKVELGYVRLLGVNGVQASMPCPVRLAAVELTNGSG